MKSTIFLNTLLVKNDDLRRGYRIAGQAIVAAYDIKLKNIRIVFGRALIEVALPGEGIIKFAAVAGEGRKREGEGIGARHVGRRILV